MVSYPPIRAWSTRILSFSAACKAPPFQNRGEKSRLEVWRPFENFRLQRLRVLPQTCRPFKLQSLKASLAGLLSDRDVRPVSRIGIVDLSDAARYPRSADKRR